jgi:4-hydroxyproline epimerase
MSREIQVIDSHTGGEPTRVVMSGGPELGGGSVARKLRVFRERHDAFRSAIVNEPRGSEVMVGGLLVPPEDPKSAAGVIFFNNVGYLGMCGHGTIGLMVTLARTGKIKTGEHRIETPVGTVSATLHDDHTVSVMNVPSYRKTKGVSIETAKFGAVKGDVAWGGNWFFLTQEHGLELELKEVGRLTEYAWAVRQAINRQGYPEVDHVELTSKPLNERADSRNFVLCPGGAYDRSPCGTGTSAKLACLFSDRKLRAGEIWRQESITGSIFEGSIQEVEGELIPTIKGTAFVNAEARLILNPADPCCWGIRS